MSRLLLSLIPLLLLCGCLEQGKHQVERQEALHGMKMKDILANDKAMKRLGALVGFTFPAYSQLVYDDKDSWGVISRETVHLKNDRETAGMNSGPSLADAVEFIETKFHPRKITLPDKVSIARWASGGALFKATVVYSSDGWTYCVIEKDDVKRP